MPEHPDEEDKRISHAPTGRRCLQRQEEEGDLRAGSGNNFIATFVARHTRFVMQAKVGNNDSLSAIQALIKHPASCQKSYIAP